MYFAIEICVSGADECPPWRNRIALAGKRRDRFGALRWLFGFQFLGKWIEVGVVEGDDGSCFNGAQLI